MGITNDNMTIVLRSLNVLTYAGVWKPVEWKGLKGRVYDSYTIIIIISHLTFLISGLMDMGFDDFEFAAMVDHLSLIVGYVQNFPKITSIVGYRRDLIDIIDKLNSYPLKLRNDEEKLIHAKYDRLDR